MKSFFKMILLYVSQLFINLFTVYMVGNTRQQNEPVCVLTVFYISVACIKYVFLLDYVSRPVYSLRWLGRDCD
jgi:hypothetical protein